MRVGRGGLVSSALTVDKDIDFLTLYQAKRLASPENGEALRKGSAEITNAEIAAGAAIAYAKLALTGKINNADIKALAAIAYTKLALTGKIKAADIEAAAGIPLSKLVAGIATGVQVVDAIAFHADIPTAHQNAPLLIANAITAAVAALPYKVAKATVNYNSSSPITVVTLPAGAMVMACASNVTTGWSWDPAAPTLMMGDAGNDDGFIEIFTPSATAPNWKPVNLPPAYGDYLWDSTNKHLKQKLYTAETAIIVTYDAADVTAGVIDFFVIYIDLSEL